MISIFNTCSGSLYVYTAFAAAMIIAAGPSRARGNDDLAPPGLSAAHEALALSNGSVADSKIQRAFEEPPALLTETPNRPSQAGLSFVPGYWAWNTDHQRYVWISGVWRKPPPNRIWIAGMWLKDEGRLSWRWSPGFWSRKPLADLEYLSSGPPDSRPAENAGMKPRPDSFFVQGYYRPQGPADQVAWTLGFWSEVRPGLVWNAPRWIERDLGWVFVPGYWDHSPLPTRDELVQPTAPSIANAESRAPSTTKADRRRRPLIVQGPPLWMRTVRIAPPPPIIPLYGFNAPVGSIPGFGINPSFVPPFSYQPPLYNTPYHFALVNGLATPYRTPSHPFGLPPNPAFAGSAQAFSLWPTYGY